MYYIYCYTNLTNQHKYVGQTNNLQRRIREHRSCAFNDKASSYNDLIHQKIREYGENNFEISILEKLYTEDINEADEREIYWIKKLETHRSLGKGYNSTWGGHSPENRSQVLTKEQIQDVKQDLKDKIPFIDIENKYHISAPFISAINHGTYFYDEKEEYPLCKYYKDDKGYDELIDLLLNSTYSLAKIAEILGLGYSTVKKINAGTMRKGLYPTYPIRKKSIYEQRADKIKELLLTTYYSNAEIAQITNASEETVRRIKIGETHFDEKLNYPLGNL